MPAFRPISYNRIGNISLSLLFSALIAGCGSGSAGSMPGIPVSGGLATGAGFRQVIPLGGKSIPSCPTIYNFKAPDKFVSKPGDQWQTAEATIIGNKISLTLNGVKVHDNIECTKATGSELDNKIDQPGPIFLQGDHGNVSFRNIRIKELK